MNAKGIGFIKMLLGAVVALFFTWVAIASFVNAVNNGGTFLIWWGAVFLGVYLFSKGLREFSDKSDAVKKAAQPKQAIIITAPISAAVIPEKLNNICGYCGASLEKGAKYCKQCGRVQPIT
jgi:hypothetical protein